MLLTPNKTKLQKHALSFLSFKFGIGKSSIKRYRTAVKKGLALGHIYPDLSRKRKRNCGRPTLLTDEVRQTIKEIVQEYATLLILLTTRLLQEELSRRGIQRSVQTVHNSKFRRKGTMITYPRSVDSKYYLELMRGDGIEQGIIDAIKEKFFFKRSRSITIQHDGAKPHNGNGNEAVINALGCSDGWKIKVKTQPAQSPDLNILDLGFFYSLKNRAQKLKRQVKNIDQLIENIKECYDNYDRKTLDKIWGSQYAVYNEILKCNGDNQYKLPHSGVNKRSQRYSTSVEVKFNCDIFNSAMEFLRTNEN